MESLHLYIQYILDPTVRFEKSIDKPAEVDAEKKSIYEPIVEDMKKKYNIKFDIQVIGILIGARGSMSNYTKTLLKDLNLPASLFVDIATSVVNGSI